MTENNFSNKNKRSWPKKEKTATMMEISDDNIDLHDSLTVEDDVSKDPDWMSTPLYKRIHKLQVIIFTFLVTILS